MSKSRKSTDEECEALIDSSLFVMKPRFTDADLTVKSFEGRDFI